MQGELYFYQTLLSSNSFIVFFCWLIKYFVDTLKMMKLLHQISRFLNIYFLCLFDRLLLCLFLFIIYCDNYWYASATGCCGQLVIEEICDFWQFFNRFRWVWLMNRFSFDLCQWREVLSLINFKLVSHTFEIPFNLLWENYFQDYFHVVIKIFRFPFYVIFGFILNLLNIHKIFLKQYR